MNQVDFEAHVSRMMDKCHDLLVVKGGEYAGSEDRLANFKRGSQLTGATPLQVALIYAAKHWDSISTFVRDGADNTERRRSESMEGRFQDLINYCLLMSALYAEQLGEKSDPLAEAHANLQKKAKGYAHVWGSVSP